MATIVLVCAAVLAWAARGGLKKARKAGGQSSNARAKLHAVVTEHIASLKAAKSYGLTDSHEQVFLDLAREARDVSLKVTNVQAELQQRLELGSTILLACIVYLAYDVLKIPLAQLFLLLFIFARLMPRLTSIYRQIQALASVSPVLGNVNQIEQECIAAAESISPIETKVQFQNSFRFENVSFAYLRRSDLPAVTNINLDIPAGLTTAIVGPSGSGKSTIADLLTGLLFPTEGRMLIDDTPITSENVNGWRREVSYVSQDTFLFHDSVRANLTWVNEFATDEELRHSLRLSAAHDFVNGLPQGLDTVIGEKGVMVSGGERQRLSLARAILRRPKVLVLDEATSSLDSENELRIQRAIEGLHQQMTIVVITHRLSTIRNADIIHVVESGRVVESGNWAELMSRSNGRFRELCRAQGIESRPGQETRQDLVPLQA